MRPLSSLNQCQQQHQYSGPPSSGTLAVPTSKFVAPVLWSQAPARNTVDRYLTTIPNDPLYWSRNATQYPGVICNKWHALVSRALLKTCHMSSLVLFSFYHCASEGGWHLKRPHFNMNWSSESSGTDSGLRLCEERQLFLSTTIRMVLPWELLVPVYQAFLAAAECPPATVCGCRDICYVYGT
ncbi:hypothetical protein BD414DRAFT_510834 [Trametes punicea]|nr:hypothetical protein BD414DRAFT_510834 [Trametes punicea]